jgi:hypothetical protein
MLSPFAVDFGGGGGGNHVACVTGKGGHGSHGGSKSSPTEVDLKRLLLTTLEGSVVGGALGCMVRAQSSVVSPQCSPPLSHAGALSSIALLFALLVHFPRRRCCLCRLHLCAAVVLCCDTLETLQILLLHPTLPRCCCRQWYKVLDRIVTSTGFVKGSFRFVATKLALEVSVWHVCTCGSVPVPLCVSISADAAVSVQTIWVTPCMSTGCPLLC